MECNVSDPSDCINEIDEKILFIQLAFIAIAASITVIGIMLVTFKILRCCGFFKQDTK